MKEIEKQVNDIWTEYYDAHPKNRMYMGHKIPKIAFLKFFHKNSVGNINADKRYVVKILELIGIDKETAEKYYDNILYGQYAQTA